MTCHTLFKLCAGRHASRHVPQRNPCVTAAVLLLLLLSRDDMWRRHRWGPSHELIRIKKLVRMPQSCYTNRSQSIYKVFAARRDTQYTRGPLQEEGSNRDTARQLVGVLVACSGRNMSLGVRHLRELPPAR